VVLADTLLVTPAQVQQFQETLAASEYNNYAYNARPVQPTLPNTTVLASQAFG